MLLEKFCNQLKDSLSTSLTSVSAKGWDLRAHTTASNLVGVLFFIKSSTSSLFNSLSDVAASDFPEKAPRFELSYNLLSTKYGTRLLLKLPADRGDVVPSITPMFPGANWMEREALDLIGVFFEGHPDLRRILTDYGFEGHPLQKDFPLTGYLETRYDGARARVVYEPVELAQEYRDFSFKSTWKTTA